MSEDYSIAIETSCRAGGVALGRGEELLDVAAFDASFRNATQVIARLDELLRRAGLRPADIAEAYVSTGPGSFTGLRVGIAAARTLAQALAGLRLVAVPTLEAVADNARDLPWENLGVVMDFKDGELLAALFTRRACIPARRNAPDSGMQAHSAEAGDSAAKVGCPPCPNREEMGGTPMPLSQPALVRPEDFLARAPRPLLLIGEAVEFVKMEAPGVTLAPADRNLPTPAGVWRVGRQKAAGRHGDPPEASGAFVHCNQLLPIYSRKPEAVRLWEKRNPSTP